MKMRRLLSWLMILVMIGVSTSSLSVFAEGEADQKTGGNAPPAAVEATTEADKQSSSKASEDRSKESSTEEKKDQETGVTTISISKSSVTLSVGDIEKLTSEVLPENAKDRGVTWKSSAEAVASVDQTGKITAKSAGEAKITVTSNDGGLTAACTVTVKEASGEEKSGQASDSGKDVNKPGSEDKDADKKESGKSGSDGKGSSSVAKKGEDSSDDDEYRTVFADGTYTDFDYIWSGGTGKAKLTLEKVVVSKGIAKGTFTASSENMTHVFYGGHTGSDQEDTKYYDPETDTCGKDVLPIKSKTVTFPVKINKTTQIACRSVAMSEPHWIQYEYTIRMTEPNTCKVRFKAENEDEETVKATLTVTDSSGKEIEPSDDVYELETGAEYNVTARAEDYETWEGIVRPTQDGGTIILRMQVRNYKVKIKAVDQADGKELKDASVQVLDEKTGDPVPPQDGDYIFSGNHKYTILVTGNDDYEDAKKEHVSVEEDKTIEIPLKAIDEDQAEKYNLTVKVKNEEGEEIADPKVEVLRETSKEIISIKPVDGVYPLIARKNHTVKISAKGYKDLSGVVQLDGDKTETFVLSRMDYPIHVRAIESATQYTLSKATITVKDSKGKTYSGKEGTYMVPFGTSLSVEAGCPGYEASDGSASAKATLEVSGEDTITLNFKRKTFTVKIAVVNASTGKAVSGAKIVVTDSATEKTVSSSGGGYPMTYSGIYSINAAASGYAPASMTHKATADTTLTLKLTPTSVPDSGSGGSETKEKVVDNGTYNIKFKDAENNMFNVVSAVLHVKDGKYTADISLSGTGYDYVYPSTAEAAIKAGKSKWSPYWVNKKGLYTYTIEVPYLDKPFILASRSSKYAKDPNRRHEAWRDGLESGGSHGSHEIILYSKYTNGKNLPTHTGTRKKSSIDPATDDSSGKSGSNSGKNTKDKDTGTTDTGKKYKSNTGGSTGSVNNRTGLKDGSYKPDSFSFSGGTGRVKIACDQVIIKGGKTYARIIFGSTYFQYVKAGGQKITKYTRGPASTSFVIPVELNKNNKILALTTKMSQPHEIGYTIYVGLNAAKTAGTGASDTAAAVTADGTPVETGGKVDDQYDKLDEKAPEIIGLTCQGQVPVTYSDLIKIYQYQDGYYLVELDVRKGTALDSSITGIEISTADEEQADTAQDASADTASAADSAGGAEDEEGAATEEKTESEQKAALYDHPVYKYLIVPEKGEIPAGIEKQLFVVQLPADKAVVTSPEALETLNTLGLNDQILGVGIPEEEITVEAVAEAMKEVPGGEPKIRDVGSYDDLDYKTLLLNHADLLLESPKVIPHLGELEGFPQKTAEEFGKMTSEEKEAFKEAAGDQAMILKKIGMRGVQLDMGVIVDRSTDEGNALAKAEWLKIYGILFNKTDKTDELYKSVVDAATEEEKKAAALPSSQGGN